MLPVVLPLAKEMKMLEKKLSNGKDSSHLEDGRVK